MSKSKYIICYYFISSTFDYLHIIILIIVIFTENTSHITSFHALLGRITMDSDSDYILKHFSVVSVICLSHSCPVLKPFD